MVILSPNIWTHNAPSIRNKRKLQNDGFIGEMGDVRDNIDELNVHSENA